MIDKLCVCGHAMEDRGAQTLILGCTELPPAFEMYDLHYPHIDPTLVLARAAVLAAGGELN